MKQTLYINLFGGPGSGKTTTLHDLISAIKRHPNLQDTITRDVQEYATMLILKNQTNMLKNQTLVTGKQRDMLAEWNGLVDIVVTDSPIALGYFYTNDIYHKFRVVQMDEQFRRNAPYCFNVFKERELNEFSKVGRVTDEEQSKSVDAEIWNTVPIHFVQQRGEDVKELCECVATLVQMIKDGESISLRNINGNFSSSMKPKY